MAIIHVTNGENLIMTLWYSLFISTVQNAGLAQSDSTFDACQTNYNRLKIEF